MSAADDKPLVGEELARAIDETPWPELTGDADASDYVDRVVYGKQPTPWPEKWAGKTWSRGGYEITEDDLRAVYESVRRGGEADDVARWICNDLAVWGLSHPSANFALQSLRKASLIEYNREDRCWRAKA